jgi:hypothetical protein
MSRYKGQVFGTFFSVGILLFIVSIFASDVIVMLAETENINKTVGPWVFLLA